MLLVPGRCFELRGLGTIVNGTLWAVSSCRSACLTGVGGEVGPFLGPSWGRSEVGWCVSRVSKTRFEHEQVHSRARRPENVFPHHPGALQGPVGGAICLPRSPSPQEGSLPATVPRKDTLFSSIYILASFSHQLCL